jgi:hypothetical protein
MKFLICLLALTIHTIIKVGTSHLIKHALPMPVMAKSKFYNLMELVNAPTIIIEMRMSITMTSITLVSKMTAQMTFT